MFLFVVQCTDCFKMNENSSCYDTTAATDPYPDLRITPIDALSPLKITIPKIESYPQHKDWDSIYISIIAYCEWDTNCENPITITAVRDYYVGQLFGRNVDGTFVSEIIIENKNDSICEFIDKIEEYLDKILIKMKCNIIENEISRIPTAYSLNLEFYKRHNYVPVEIKLRLIPEKK